ncbi:MAG: polysaccharide deacetylase family protein [Armatimonadota bacterium]
MKHKSVARMVMEFAACAYPDFVYGKTCGRVPVFCMHGVDASFEEKLAFLAENGYRTITTDEMHLLGSGERAVMLTSDDGWGSLAEVGLPLLQKYGAKMVVFLATARMGEKDFLNWDEVRKMHATGLFDFQSHTHTHGRVFDSPHIVDFLGPEYLAKSTCFHVPEGEMGRPIYTSSPRLVALRYVEDEDLRRVCEKYANCEGFFERQGWRAELRRLAEAHGASGRYETGSERRQAIAYELLESKRLIEEYLPGKSVEHLCYPWHAFTPEVVEISHDIGYSTNFAGKLDGRYFGVRAGKPSIVARVGEDFFFRLPGRGRRSLSQVLAAKLRRRV